MAAIATGGASLVATAAVAGVSAAATRAIVEVTDLATNDIDGDVNSENLDKIAKEAMIEGAVAGVTAGVFKGGSMIRAGSRAVTNETSQALVRVGSNETGAVAKSVQQVLHKKRSLSDGAQAAKALIGDGGAAEASATKSFVHNAFSKVSKTGIKGLSSEESLQLAKVLGIKPEELANINKKQVIELLKKFHPDINPGLPYGEDLTGILIFILREL